MIGYLQGTVLFSDGNEIIVGTNSGIGYQIFYKKVLVEGSVASLFVSHIIRENAQELYGFCSLREKKLFEMMLTVKGVGPKSAFVLISTLGVLQTIDAVNFENKKVLSSVPGIGQKTSAQIILDLKDKINKIKMYSDARVVLDIDTTNEAVYKDLKVDNLVEMIDTMDLTDSKIMSDTIMACKELGFKEDKIIPLAQKILETNNISRPEQLIHLVLKEI